MVFPHIKFDIQIISKRTGNGKRFLRFPKTENDLLENRETKYRVRKRRLEHLRIFSDLLAGVLLVFGFAFPWLCALVNNSLAEIIGFLPCMYYVWCGTVRIPIPAPAAAYTKRVNNPYQ